MKGLRSTFPLLCMLLFLIGTSDLDAQCTASCSNSDPECPNFSCCVSESNPYTFGKKKAPIATNAQVGDFNCHQYVKAYIYGGYSGQQILDCDVQSECPCINYKNGSFTGAKDFVQVQSESKASAIYYPCDHSAVRIGFFQYVSKDGHGGHLYAHGPTEYATNHPLCYPYTYWTFLGQIETSFSGNSIDGPEQLSLINNTEVNYEWCATPSNLVSISGGNSANPTITPIGNGTVEIKVTATGHNNSEKTQCITLNVSDGTPECSSITISGTVTTAGYTSSLKSYNSIFSTRSTVNLGSTFADHFDWIKTSGNASFSTNSNGSIATLTMQTSQSLAFTIKAFNSSDYCIGTRNVFFQCTTTGGGFYVSQEENTFISKKNTENLQNLEEEDFNSNTTEEFPNSSKISIYPNPARDFLNIKLSEHPIKSIALFDLTGKNVIQEDLTLSAQSHQLNLSSLATGIYYVRILDEIGNLVIKKILIQ